MWRRFDGFAYGVAILSSVPFLYVALTYVGRAVEDGTGKTLVYLGTTALWANVFTSLTYYRRRLKQVAPDEM